MSNKEFASVVLLFVFVVLATVLIWDYNRREISAVEKAVLRSGNIEVKVDK